MIRSFNNNHFMWAALAAFVLFAFVVLGFAAEAPAAILASEDFESYAPGTYPGSTAVFRNYYFYVYQTNGQDTLNGGTGWNGGWGNAGTDPSGTNYMTAQNFTVAAGGPTGNYYDGSTGPNTGFSYQGAPSRFFSQTIGDSWQSFDISAAGSSDAGVTFIAPDGFWSFQIHTDLNGGYGLAEYNGAQETVNTLLPASTNPAQPDLVLSEIVGNTVDLWINPTNTSSVAALGTPDATIQASVTGLTGITLQGLARFDNILVGDNLKDVLPAVPVTGLTWNGGGGANGPIDGDGTWSVGGGGWWNNSTSSSATWSDGSDAIFGAGSGTAGTVAISGAVSPNSITFNAAGSGSYTLTGGTIDMGGSLMPITANVDATIASTLTDGGIQKLGTGNLKLTSNNSYTGQTSVSAGTLTLTGNNAIGSTSGNGNVSVDVYGAGSVLQILGSTTLADTNSTNVSAGGTLVITGAYATSNADQIIAANSHGGGAGTVILSGTGTWTNSSASGNYNVFEVGTQGSNLGTLMVNDSASLDLSGAYFGILMVGYDNYNQSGPVSGIVVQNGGTVKTFPTATGWLGDSTGPGMILGGGAGGSAEYHLNGGTLSVPNIVNVTNNGSQLTTPAGSAIFYFNGGVLQATQGDDTFSQDSIMVAEGSNHLIANISHAYIQAGGAIVDTNGFDTSINQPLEHDPALGSTPDGGLQKIGAGTLTLLMSGSYTGGTTVSGGVLQLGDDNALGLGSLTVASSLDIAGFNPTVTALSGTGTIGNSGASAGTLTVNAGGNFQGTLQDDFGGSGAQLALQVSGGTLVLSPAAPGNNFTGGTVVSAGVLVLDNDEALADGSSLTVGDASLFAGPVAPASAGGAGAIASALTPVPEPGTLALLAAGGLALAAWRKRRGRRWFA